MKFDQPSPAGQEKVNFIGAAMVVEMSCLKMSCLSKNPNIQIGISLVSNNDRIAIHRFSVSFRYPFT